MFGRVGNLKALMAIAMSLCVSVVMGCDPKDEEEPGSDEVCEAGSGTIVTVSQSPDEHETGYMNAETEGLCEKYFGFTQTNEAFNAYFKEKYGKDFSYKSVKSCKNHLNEDHENIGHVVFCPTSLDGHLDEEDFYQMTGCKLGTGKNCTMEQDLFSEFHVCHCSEGEQLYCGKDNVNPCSPKHCNCATGEYCTIEEREACQGKTCDCETGENCSEEELKACNTTLECKADEHIYENACESDSIENCGAHGKVCTVEHGSPACVNKECVVDKCDDGYDLNYGKCVEKGAISCPELSHVNGNECELDDADNCGAHGKKCPEIENGFGECVRGDCEKRCNVGYHFYDSENGEVCEEDSSLNCGSHDRSCAAALEHAEKFDCEKGACVAKLCEVGYHINEINQSCVKDETECDKDEHLYNNSCESDDDLNCGAHGIECHDPHGFSVCWERRCMSTTCESGYHSPVYEDMQYVYGMVPNETCIPDCEVGFHWDLSINKCMKDDYRNCGEYGKYCEFSGGIRGACKDGKCVNLECYPKYTEENGVCKACQYGYHSYNGQCEKDEYNHCGEHEVNCQELVDNENNHIKKVQCSLFAVDKSLWSAACNVIECESGYKRTVRSHGGYTVGDGCVASCTDGMHAYNDVCEPDTIENCGSHGHNCWDDAIAENAEQLRCRDGKCEASECKEGYFYDFYDGMDHCVMCKPDEVVYWGARCGKLPNCENESRILCATSSRFIYNGKAFCNNDNMCEVECDNGYTYKQGRCVPAV